MSIHVVENVHGKAHVKWLGAATLFLGLYSACGLVPALAIWLLSFDANATRTALAVGFSMACCTLPILIIQQLRTPIGDMPSGS
jgi:phosphatidylserine synthase